MTVLDSHLLASVIAAPIRDLTAVLIAALIAGGLLARAPAARWGAILTALAIAPLLLAGSVLDDDRASRLLNHPALLVGGGIAGVIALVVAVLVLLKWPQVLPVLIATALPLRLPLTIGGESVNLLLPLYGLIGAAAIAAAIRARRRGRELASEWDLRSGPPTSEVIKEAWTARSLSGFAAAVPVLLAASIALYALQIPFSLDADRGVQTFCFFLVPFAAMFVVLRDIEFDRRQLLRVGIALIVLGLIAVALGDYEYSTKHVLWNQNVIDSNSLNATTRVNSLFFDPNIYGRFLMILLLGILSALAWGARGVRAVVLAALFAVLWVGLLWTFSQSSMLGLLVGSLVLLALRFGAGKAAAVTAGLALVAVIAVAAFGSFLHLNVTSSKSVGDSLSGRGDLIQGGVELFESKPIFGWGSGSYRAAYRQERKVSDVGEVAASHTIPVTVAAEQGVIGLLVYIALLVAAVVALLRRARARMERAAIAAAFIALIVHSWFYAAFLEDPFTWALLAVGLGLGAADDDAATAAEQAAGEAHSHTPHDIVGEVTLVGVGEGRGPGTFVGESGLPPESAAAAHGHVPPVVPGPAPMKPIRPVESSLPPTAPASPPAPLAPPAPMQPEIERLAGPVQPPVEPPAPDEPAT